MDQKIYYNLIKIFTLFGGVHYEKILGNTLVDHNDQSKIIDYQKGENNKWTIIFKREYFLLFYSTRILNFFLLSVII